MPPRELIALPRLTGRWDPEVHLSLPTPPYKSWDYRHALLHGFHLFPASPSIFLQHHSFVLFLYLFLDLFCCCKARSVAQIGLEVTF